jgi:putative cardiolipin synthase
MHQAIRLQVFVTILAIMVTGCATGPIEYPRSYSKAITDTHDTEMGRAAAEWRAEHPETSGVYPLVKGNDAFGTRLALIDIAERSIDAQYFLMKNDMAGLVFVDKLLEAADRGVRVRLLLDDVFTEVDDDNFLLINQHPNVEMRLFNPVGRGAYWLNYIADFDRANRRMHNKSFTVDNQVTIVGGRNIAEEYFELKSKEEFRDFDVIVLGPAAAEVGEVFDRFWNHELSVPVEAFSKGEPKEELDVVRAEIDKDIREQSNSIYAKATGSKLIQDLFFGREPLFPAEVEVITDDPDKLRNMISRDHQILINRMGEVIANAQSEVIVVTPYLIPGDEGIEFWEYVADKGVRVIMLTNSLASNNHIPVHAAYARYRHRLIQAGIELHEMRVNAIDISEDDEESAFESVTLHTKAIMVDRRFTFIGSLNLDPRSIDINTEMGVLVDSEELAEGLATIFIERLPKFTYRVVEDENGDLRWNAVVNGKKVIEDSEPQADTWRRLKAFFSRILPEGQL